MATSRVTELGTVIDSALVLIGRLIEELWPERSAQRREGISLTFSNSRLNHHKLLADRQKSRIFRSANWPELK